MFTKKKRSATEKSSKKKVDDLKLNKETVKDLTDSEAKRVQGGRFPRATSDPQVCNCTDARGVKK